MILEQNNINNSFHDKSYDNKFLPIYDDFDENECYIDNIYIDKLLNINFNVNNFYNIFIFDKFFKYTNKIKFKSLIKLQKTVLNINKTNATLKSGKVFRHKLITCIGMGDKWIGIGNSKHTFLKKAIIKSMNISKKYIYNLNLKCNDYKQFKYKGCKFKIIDMTENKKNLKIYNNIMSTSGDKKIKLISYSSKNPVNVLKSILHFF